MEYNSQIFVVVNRFYKVTVLFALLVLKAIQTVLLQLKLIPGDSV